MSGTGSIEQGPRGAGPAAKRMPSPKKYAFWTTVKLASSGD
jgi:hypothetical protein